MDRNMAVITIDEL